MDERKGDVTGVVDVTDHEQDMTENFIPHWRKRNPETEYVTGATVTGPARKPVTTDDALGDTVTGPARKPLTTYEIMGLLSMALLGGGQGLRTEYGIRLIIKYFTFVTYQRKNYI